MERKTVIFTVVASVDCSEGKDWLRSVRTMRKILKEQIGSIPDVKVLKIDSKDG